MAQVLSTFSRLEQSRFEAFRRATFCGDAISRYIAQCMVQTHEQRYGLAALPPPPAAAAAAAAMMIRPSDNNNNAGATTTTTRTLQPQLEHLCAPDHAEEITIVVSTLAKSYAQRLVTAARRAATDDAPIQPKHILQVYRERQASGLDPGFFLQPPPLRAITVPTSTAEGQAKYNLRRLAALGLQDEYDKQQKQQEEAAAVVAAAAAAAAAAKKEEEEKERAKAKEEEEEKAETERAQEAKQQQQQKQDEQQQDELQLDDAKSEQNGEGNQQTDAKEESTNKDVEAPTPMELELDDPTAL
jgi:flagellar biosynthesis GTPase FlhF